MIKRFAYLLAVAGLLSGCAHDTAMYQQVHDGEFSKLPVIYSTTHSELASGQWRFLLMPGEYTPRSAPNYSHLYALPELAAAFRTLHQGTHLEWRDDPPNLWRFPPELLKQRVKAAAAKAGLTIRTSPIIIE
jgi:hypothetical protein